MVDAYLTSADSWDLVPLTPEQRAKLTFDARAAVLDLLGELTAEERVEVFAYFCLCCAFPVQCCRCNYAKQEGDE